MLNVFSLLYKLKHSIVEEAKSVCGVTILPRAKSEKNEIPGGGQRMYRGQ